MKTSKPTSKAGAAARGRPMVRIPLTEAREKRSLSLADLAELSGVRKSTIYRIEHEVSRPYPKTRRKLALALEMEPEKIAWPE